MLICMILTYKYRIKDKSAKKILRQHAIAVNQVWNYCNAVQRESEDRYRAGRYQRYRVSNFDLCKLASGTSAELGIAAQTINRICYRYIWNRDAAGGSVKFRTSFGPRRSLGWIPFSKQDAKVTGNLLTYRRRKFRLFGHKRRPVPEIFREGCFVEDARGRWYISFIVDVDLHASGDGRIGVDLGLKTLATCSNGDKVASVQHYRKYQVSLSISQRAGNKRRVKAIHAKIANARRDQLHKASTKIVRENSLIVVGNVNAAKLAKTRMAKSVFDAAWSMFRTMLRYKSSRAGASFIEANERSTSVTCSECGALSGPKGQKGLRIRCWECSDCGMSHDRDINAAKNILNVGLSAQARADESRRIAA